MTLIEKTKKGIKTPIVKNIAKSEGIASEVVTKDIAKGVIVIPIQR